MTVGLQETRNERDCDKQQMSVHMCLKMIYTRLYSMKVIGSKLFLAELSGHIGDQVTLSCAFVTRNRLVKAT